MKVFFYFLQSYVDSVGNNIIVTENADIQPETADGGSKLASDEALQSVLVNQKTIMQNQTLIMATQQTMVKELFDQKKILNELYKRVDNLKALTPPPQPKVPTKISIDSFDQIIDENTLIAF